MNGVPIQIGLELMAKAEKFGLGPQDAWETKRALRDMLDASAPVTHERGNRRYKEFVFRVRNGVAIDMSLYAV